MDAVNIRLRPLNKLLCRDIYMTEKFDLGFSFKSHRELEKERIESLLTQPISSLKDVEVFEIIQSGLALERLIPVALDIIEKAVFINFADFDGDEYSMLEKHRAFFDQNQDQKKKFERLKLWKKNRGNCINQKSGKLRKSYLNEAQAAQKASDFSFLHGEQVPYKCDSCGEWHLAPTSRHTPNKTCEYCTDENGERKQLYLSKDAAIQRAEIILKERGASLNTYECPHQNGWHLTKKGA